MYETIFRNRWFALAFVVLTLAGVSTLVGREGEKGVLQKTQDQVIATRDGVDQVMEDRSLTMADESDSEIEESVEFATDGELIDSAEGYDPSPESELGEAAVGATEDEAADGPSEEVTPDSP